MTLILRLPHRFGDYLAGVIALSVFIGLIGYGLGVVSGYRWGERKTMSDLSPVIDANQSEIAVLYERLMALEKAVTMETTASFYGGVHHGKQTASGELFDRNAFTAASPWLPFGSRWKVTRIDTGASVTVTVNDRGPHPRLGRGLDLSEAAARELNMFEEGVVRVRLEPGLTE